MTTQASNPERRKKWKVKVIGWANMESYLNDMEDDGYKIMEIFEQKNTEDGNLDDYCLVVAKDQKATQKKRFY